ncbi:hypothetical protein BLS_000734 [Venturia inaequalis]|uniref:MYND-type domain-containing protein n=1 Tax=Venturia inaequalis TaxID=5025 RepID=A0A8H3ZC38_VENIN|nr:hypothetical protein BLS_000734 [Venturia inaequalis]KAE9986906.1 hypothetical protein EG328_004348 [Venturia inaequalis]RDI81060.1 hypothetical protein Vi05172_g8952 [Venturia inaequalis]
MAPPNFPNGMSLHDIGFAALKYPALPPPPYNVPVGNMIGALQRVPSGAQNQMIAQIASQYLTALLDYETSDEPALHDQSLPQYYISSALSLLNFLSTSPDVSKRIVARPAIINNVIEKLLDPTFVKRMKAVQRPGGFNFPAATFDADFGTLLQTVSTVFLYTDDVNATFPRARELIPKLRQWEREYKRSPVKSISNVCERLIPQIEDAEEMFELATMMRGAMSGSLVCGVASCGISGPENLTTCSGCHIQRYCGRDHQRADWKYHKRICNKGLVEEETTTAEPGAEGS